ncbi:MAG: transglycosylase SLT domain-containing protein [Bdellovibrionota bacterium]
MNRFWKLSMDVLVLMFYINIVGIIVFFISPHMQMTEVNETKIMMKKTTQQIDPIVKRYARLHGMDWRFIYAMIYVESSFEENARSRAGAVGLMQVMPTVGQDLDINNLYLPRQNIKAGVRHFYDYVHRIKGNTMHDRIHMALAAYNGGIGHIYDAKRLAQQRGLDPFSWSSIKKVLPDLENPEIYRQTRHGYCQGRQIIQYVEKIHKMYRRYKSAYPALPTIEEVQQRYTTISMADTTP